MSKEFSIAGRKLGPDHPPLVIAEVGINHEGEIKKALQLVDAAADAGDPAVLAPSDTGGADLVEEAVRGRTGRLRP